MEKIFHRSSGFQIRTVVEIPFCNRQQHGSDFDLDRARTRCVNYGLDLLGTYSEILVGSLGRRMTACMNNLKNHISDIEYCDNCGHIVYVRKDGTKGQFNVRSYEAMEDALEALQQGSYKKFLENPVWVDQTLKALLNDTEHHQVDLKEFKYSELVSLLCEAHVAAFQSIPF